MSRSIYEMAKKYYQEGKWNRAQIDNLYAKGRLVSKKMGSEQRGEEKG